MNTDLFTFVSARSSVPWNLLYCEVLWSRIHSNIEYLTFYKSISSTNFIIDDYLYWFCLNEKLYRYMDHKHNLCFLREE